MPTPLSSFSLSPIIPPSFQLNVCPIRSTYFQPCSMYSTQPIPRESLFSSTLAQSKNPPGPLGGTPGGFAARIPYCGRLAGSEASRFQALPAQPLRNFGLRFVLAGLEKFRFMALLPCCFASSSVPEGLHCPPCPPMV